MKKLKIFFNILTCCKFKIFLIYMFNCKNYIHFNVIGVIRCKKSFNNARYLCCKYKIMLQHGLYAYLVKETV